MAELLSINHNPGHFEVRHENGKEILCLARGQECAVAVEIDDIFNDEEIEGLEAATSLAFEYVDALTSGRTADIFEGLTIKVGEGLAQGGGEAVPAENLILLNGHKLMVGIEEMKAISGTYGEEDLVSLPLDQATPGSAFTYTLVHEMGHILDERLQDGLARQRISVEHSPTKYGRVPDQWHTDKEHEAFAEGFAHMAFGLSVDNEMKTAVNQALEKASVAPSSG